MSFFVSESQFQQAKMNDPDETEAEFAILMEFGPKALYSHFRDWNMKHEQETRSLTIHKFICSQSGVQSLTAVSRLSLPPRHHHRNIFKLCGEVWLFG